MEMKSAQNADVFTTVSDITAKECEQFLLRKPDFVTINGINSDFKGSLESARNDSRKKIFEIIDTLCGKEVSRDSSNTMRDTSCVKSCYSALSHIVVLCIDYVERCSSVDN